MNTPAFLRMRENTAASFRAAQAAGAAWVETDVQVTKDGVPVLWHDDYVRVFRDESRTEVDQYVIADLTLSELRARLPAGAAPPRGSNQCIGPRVGGGIALHHTLGGSPWECEVEDTVPTLEEAIHAMPPGLNVNVELKFIDMDLPPLEEIHRRVELIYSVLAPFSSDRTFAFSSFDADAALHARRIQHFHPVFFLTCAQKSENLCPRRRTIDAALDVAIDGGLDGVVLDVDEFLSAPPELGSARGIIQKATKHGLLVAAYGGACTQRDVSLQLAELGVAGIITDDIEATSAGVEDFVAMRDVKPEPLCVGGGERYSRPNWAKAMS